MKSIKKLQKLDKYWARRRRITFFTPIQYLLRYCMGVSFFIDSRVCVRVYAPAYMHTHAGARVRCACVQARTIPYAHKIRTEKKKTAPGWICPAGSGLFVYFPSLSIRSRTACKIYPCKLCPASVADARICSASALYGFISICEYFASDFILLFLLASEYGIQSPLDNKYIIKRQFTI